MLYGAFKPRATLELFRDDLVCDAFRTAFYADDPDTLHRAVAAALDRCRAGCCRAARDRNPSR